MITPIQQVRTINPFEKIDSQLVNYKNRIFLTEDGKSIIKGLLAVYDTSDLTKLILKSGSFVKDFVIIHFPYDTEIDVSSYSDGEYYLVCKYTYAKIQPPPEASIDLIPVSSLSNDVVICKVSISGGQLNHNAYTSFIDNQGNYVYSGTNCALNYSDRTSHILKSHIEYFLSQEISGDLDLKHNKIIHLGIDETSITDPLDAVNKAYVDNAITSGSSSLDQYVKVDSTDSSSGFLGDKIQVGDNLTKQLLNDDYTSPLDSSKSHIVLLTGLDEKIEISSGDSQSSYLDDKVTCGNGIQKEIVSGSVGDSLKLNILVDSQADSLTTHGGQSSIEFINVNISGNSFNVLSVSDIFIHKSGNIDETITGNKDFQNDVTIQGNLTVNGTISGSIDADTLDGHDSTYFATATHTHSFLDLSDTPNDYTGNSGKALIVNSSEDGLIFSDINATDADTLDGYDSATSPTPNSIPVTDSNGYLNGFINQGSGSGLDADTLDGLDSSEFLRVQSGYFDSFSSKNLVHIDDILLIEDSADGYSKKKIRVNSLLSNVPILVSSNYTVTRTGVYVVNTDLGNVTITLPQSGSDASGYKIVVKNDGANDVIIQCQGSDLIDGNSQYTLVSDTESITIYDLMNGNFKIV